MYGSSVLTSVSDRLADRTVTAGEGFFRRLVTRSRGTVAGQATESEAGPLDGTGAFDAERAGELDALLDRLDEEERRKFAEAVAAWLRGPSQELDADHLMRHVHRVAGSTAHQVTYNTANAHGPHSIAANTIGTIVMGGAQPPQDRR